MVKLKGNLPFFISLIYIFVEFQLIISYDNSNGFCTIGNEAKCYPLQDNLPNRRYIFYDVNPPEGFNLRRDVYMRYAIFANYLAANSEIYGNIMLVLPPWSFLYHWKRTENPEQIPWSSFFDLNSLQTFAPVIEMHQFFEDMQPTFKKIKIDKVYILQHYIDMFDTNKFNDKLSIEECNDRPNTIFFYYQNLTSDNVKCLSFHGFTSQLKQVIENSTAKTILFDHAEVALHDNFGSKIYWQCRRSMRFNSDLIKSAEKFREEVLNSSNWNDNVDIPADWREEKPHRKSVGGPYLAVHLRRRDFVRARSTEVPNLQDASEQIMIELNRLQLKTVFIATDAPNKEYNEIAKYIRAQNFRAVNYEHTRDELKQYREGEVAIIDQIICSHAQYFIGTHESTFSFRIQEQREIFGFRSETTFNRLCGDNSRKCSPPSIWKIVY